MAQHHALVIDRRLVLKRQLLQCASLPTISQNPIAPYLLWSQFAANRTRIFLPYLSKLDRTPGNPSFRACLIPGSVALRFLNISRFCCRYSKYWARRRKASKWLNFRALRKRRMKASSVLRKPMSGRVMIMSLTSCMSWCKVSGFSFNSTLAFSRVSGDRPACKWVIVLPCTGPRLTILYSIYYHYIFPM